MIISNIFRIASIRILAIALAAISLTAHLEASEGRAPFTQVISFGDSLSDTGNLYAASGAFSLPLPISKEGPQMEFFGTNTWQKI